jgi:hypothetical protein
MRSAGAPKTLLSARGMQQFPSHRGPNALKEEDLFFYLGGEGRAEECFLVVVNFECIEHAGAAAMQPPLFSFVIFFSQKRQLLPLRAAAAAHCI